jgi:hypothetical protein
MSSFRTWEQVPNGGADAPTFSRTKLVLSPDQKVRAGKPLDQRRSLPSLIKRLLGPA